jgi:hypothetical protein
MIQNPLNDSLYEVVEAQQAGGAGNQVFSYTNPHPCRIELQAIQCQVATDATVANRIFRVTLAGPTITNIQVCHPTDHPASYTYTYTGFQGATVQSMTSNSRRAFPLPIGLKIDAGGLISVQLDNGQAGDTIGTIYLTMKMQVMPSSV